jgi:hypothetical protein
MGNVLPTGDIGIHKRQYVTQANPLRSADFDEGQLASVHHGVDSTTAQR